MEKRRADKTNIVPGRRNVLGGEDKTTVRGSGIGCTEN